jgi:hypothetical protein
MICKVADRGRVIHYNVVGFRCPVLLCQTRYCANSTSPVSWRRAVDCMACLVRFASLAWCGHGPGEVVHVDPRFDGEVRRQCGRCSGAT